ncbi:MAG: polymer-forming cytoskeletal protein [Candidatus Aminicenantes bacterium]|nr:polymer-forming cytoskeletal protein [Candidatus Aminicenantes bacterium]
MTPHHPSKDGTGKPTPFDAAGSRLAAAMTFKGELSGSGPLVIDGCFKGSIRCPEADLTIGSAAQVEADIVAANVEVAGTVTGNLQASGRIVIASQARMSGDLCAGRVAIQDGARFKGTVKITRPAT